MARSSRKRRDEAAQAAPPPPPAPAATPPIVAGEPYTGPRLEEFAGAKVARAWGERLQRDIADYRAGRIAWEAVDRGAVLVGPTGTGKTTFVKALAAATGLALVITSYREWMAVRDGHQGSMMQAMQHVFQQAAAAKPSILFIDELDSLPPRAATREHRDWYIGAVNALLELLDGGRRREGVVAIGACNDPERLDPALVRPGRMDRVITMELPSIEEITDILAFHAGGSIERAELGRIAVLATGSSGAQIEAVVREARREARHANREMTTADLWAAVTGSDKVLPADLVRRTAVHEAGHAFAAIHLGIARTVSVSIVRRGESLGATRIERVLQSQTRLVIEREIAVNLAGRAAEDVILGSVSSGAGGGEDSDLARATGAAVRMVAAYGLSETAGLVWHGPALMEQMVLAQPQLAAEVRTILDRCYGVACDLVRRERPAFERLVDGLIDRRGLAHAEIVALIGTPPVNG